MINLIPKTAKKSIIVEYWLRVVSVWWYLWAIAIFGGVFIMVPSYVLITSQVSGYASSAQLASAKVANYDEVSKELTETNKQAETLLAGLKLVPASGYIALFEKVQGPGITLSEISLNRSKEGFAPVSLSGEASDRQSLAAFRDRLLAQPQVASVDLPISNLAKDKDILFTITVTLNNSVLP